MARQLSLPRIGLDTQCFSYLLDAIGGIDEPIDPLADERKALIRCWFYLPETFYLPTTVVAECQAIRNEGRKELHESFIRTLFLDLSIQNHAAVEARVSELLGAHPSEKDRRVLAEAEDLNLAVLLTYDHDFLSHLSSVPKTVRISKPSTYWASVGVPRGAKPRMVPHPTNPLSQQSWWRW